MQQSSGLDPHSVPCDGKWRIRGLGLPEFEPARGSVAARKKVKTLYNANYVIIKILKSHFSDLAAQLDFPSRLISFGLV